MKFYSCCVIVLMFAAASAAQSIEGIWEGMLPVRAGELKMGLRVAKGEKNALQASLIAQGAENPATNITFSDSTLRFEVQRVSGFYEGKLNAEGNVIAGTWTQRGTQRQLNFNRVSNSSIKAVDFPKRSVTVGKNTYGYRVYLPENFDAKKSYPAVLYLHGLGSNGTDNEKQTLSGLGSAIRRNPNQFSEFVVVFPQAPENQFWIGENVEQAVKALDQTVSEFKADPKRLYLVGRSAGGLGTWYTAANYPSKFAAVVPISGSIFPPGTQKVPPQLRPLIPAELLKLYDAENPFAAFAKRLGKTPVWIFHGTRDAVVPITDSRKMSEALRSANADVRFTEYPEAEHDLPMVFENTEFWKWILEQKVHN